MPFPKNGNHEEAEGYSAVQLFGQGARRVRSQFRLAEERPHVMRICQLVEGMPLAIELASAQVREHPCAQIAQQIEHNLNLLATTLRDVPVRHRSLRAAFDHSWNLLTHEEKDAFGRLSVFRGGFQIEAAEQVANASPELLNDLVFKSLLRQLPGGRYEILEVLRQHNALTHTAQALEGLGQLDEAARVYRQALEWRRELNQPHLAIEPLERGRPPRDL